MLFALFIAGLAAAAVAPVLLSDGADDADDDVDETSDDRGAFEPLDGLDEDGITYDVPASVGAAVVESFEPGIDTLRINVISTEASFAEAALADGDGTGLDVLDGDTVSQIAFPNLNTLPVDDIDVVFLGDGQEVSAVVPLTDLLDTVLQPETDSPTVPTGEDPGDALVPETGATVPTGETPDGTPLAPTVDPDPLDGVQSFAALAPESDVQSDDGVAATTDTVVYAGATGSDPVIADLENFDVASDTVRIVYYVTDPALPALLEVAPSWDGADSIVTVNSEILAILRGAPDATEDNVILQIETLLRAAQV